MTLDEMDLAIREAIAKDIGIDPHIETPWFWHRVMFIAGMRKAANIIYDSPDYYVPLGSKVIDDVADELEQYNRRKL